MRIFGQFLILILALFLIWHGLTGPQFAPKNLTTLFTWVHYRGLLVFTLLLMGNYFCTVCPMMLVRNLARRFVTPRFSLPRSMQRKWPGIILFVGVLFVYEQWNLWASPFLTALLILLPFVLILITDLLFKKANFCKYVCPIGQFNFVASLVSPQELQTKDPSVCEKCTTFDCLNGNPQKKLAGSLGCELDLFLPTKVGNMDCTFCMECVHACPSENVHVTTRVPASELLNESHRAGVGKLSQRKDILWLIMIFVMGALLNAFGMVGPAYQLQDYLISVVGPSGDWIALLIFFILFIVLIPKTLLTIFPPSLIPSLVPIGFGVWIAHYSFHFLTGIFTFVPVMQGLLGIQRTFPINWMGLPEKLVLPIEFGFILMGLLGSMMVSGKLFVNNRRLLAGWFVVLLTISGFAIWLMSLPMEMRGTAIGLN
jgi:ferredoxin